jgi:hypothetical protein
MIVVLHLIVTVWNSMATTYNALIFYLKNNFNFTYVLYAHLETGRIM